LLKDNLVCLFVFCLSAAELVMGHPRNPTAYYLASTLLAYRRLRPNRISIFARQGHHARRAIFAARSSRVYITVELQKKPHAPPLCRFNE